MLVPHLYNLRFISFPDRVFVVSRIFRGPSGLAVARDPDSLYGRLALRHDPLKLPGRSPLVALRHPDRRQLRQDSKLFGIRHLIVSADALRLLSVALADLERDSA